MENSVYDLENDIEEYHWWFRGRRTLVRKILADIQQIGSLCVLDIGTSTGTNLRLLDEFHFKDVMGMDASTRAVKFCKDKGHDAVLVADAKNIPYVDGTFDLIIATDIIEHIDDDKAALHEIRRLLKADGTAILTVPAFMSLWGTQDNISHHKRRYRKSELTEKLKETGFQIKDVFYFNYILFVPIWLARKTIALLRLPVKNENAVNSNLLNKLLGAVFRFDVKTARAVNPPFGVSIFVLVSK